MTTSKITELLFGYSSKDGSVLQQQVVVVAESAGQNNLQMGSMYVCFFFDFEWNKFSEPLQPVLKILQFKKSTKS